MATVFVIINTAILLLYIRRILSRKCYRKLIYLLYYILHLIPLFIPRSKYYIFRFHFFFCIRYKIVHLVTRTVYIHISQYIGFLFTVYNFITFFILIVKVASNPIPYFFVSYSFPTLIYSL